MVTELAFLYKPIYIYSLLIMRHMIMSVCFEKRSLLSVLQWQEEAIAAFFPT